MTPLSIARHLLLAPLMAMAAMSACGGRAGDAAGNAPLPNTRPALRALSGEFLARKAVAYSGYRGADHRSPPTEAQVLQDLRLLVQGGFRLIRVFGADDFDTGVVLRTIRAHGLDLKLQLGIWIKGPKASADAVNRANIANGIALAQAYPDIVLAVSVGNETMVDWSLHIPPADMVGYIRSVRTAVTQPVTTDDNWAVFANVGNQYATDSVLAEIDFVSMHTYPLLDSVYVPGFAWKNEGVPEVQRAMAMMDAMLDKAKADYAAVKGYMAAHGFELPVTIGETGWKAVGPQADRIHPVNQKMYLDRLAAWRDSPRQIFYFEAFDEPWKGDDDGWGLFDVNRKARYAVQALYAPAQGDGTHYRDADAVCWHAPQALH